MIRFKRTRLRIGERILAALMGCPTTRVGAGEPFSCDNPAQLTELAEASLNAAEYLMSINKKRGWISFIWQSEKELLKTLSQLRAIERVRPQPVRAPQYPTPAPSPPIPVEPSPSSVEGPAVSLPQPDPQ